MKTTSLTALVAALVFAAVARAGGPPPMYVLVEKVVLEPDEQKPERVQLWGCFTRISKSSGYTAPVYGWMYLSGGDECRQQWLQLSKDAGSGKVLAIGHCFQAQQGLALPIRKPEEHPDKPDGAYPLAEIGLYDNDLYARGRFDNHDEVRQLRAFAKEQREARTLAQERRKR
jgi:hypothetical protein